MTKQTSLDGLFAAMRDEAPVMSRSEARTIISGAPRLPATAAMPIRRGLLIGAGSVAAVSVGLLLWLGPGAGESSENARSVVASGQPAPAETPARGTPAFVTDSSKAVEPATGEETTSDVAGRSAQRVGDPTAQPTPGVPWGYRLPAGLRLIYRQRYESSQGSLAEGWERETELFVARVEGDGRMHLQFATLRDTVWQNPPLADLVPSNVQVIRDLGAPTRYEATIGRDGSVLGTGIQEEQRITFFVNAMIRPISATFPESGAANSVDTGANSYQFAQIGKDGEVSMRTANDTTFTSRRYAGVRAIRGVQCHVLIRSARRVHTVPPVEGERAEDMAPTNVASIFEELHLRTSDGVPVRVIITETTQSSDGSGMATRDELELIREDAPSGAEVGKGIR